MPDRRRLLLALAAGGVTLASRNVLAVELARTPRQTASRTSPAAS